MTRFPTDAEIAAVNEFLAGHGLRLYESAGLCVFPAYAEDCSLLCAQTFVLVGGDHALGVVFSGNLIEAVPRGAHLFGEHAKIVKEGEKFPVVKLSGE